MKLEDQVCSLALARKLKELGVKQASLFYWHLLKTPFVGPAPTKIGDSFLITAFTVAELGEMLPFGSKFWPVKQHDRKWSGLGLDAMPIANETTEASARALMLIYLIENKLVTP